MDPCAREPRRLRMPPETARRQWGVTPPRRLVLLAGTRIGVTCDYDNGVTKQVRLCDDAPRQLRGGPLADDAMCLVSGCALTL